jgi:hypothetical protein
VIRVANTISDGQTHSLATSEDGNHGAGAMSHLFVNHGTDGSDDGINGLWVVATEATAEMVFPASPKGK